MKFNVFPCRLNGEEPELPYKNRNKKSQNPQSNFEEVDFCSSKEKFNEK